MSTLPEGWSYGEDPKDGFIYREGGDGSWIVEAGDQVLVGRSKWQESEWVGESASSSMYRRPWSTPPKKDLFPTDMSRAVATFNAFTGRDLTVLEGCLLMQYFTEAKQWREAEAKAKEGQS